MITKIEDTLEILGYTLDGLYKICKINDHYSLAVPLEIKTIEYSIGDNMDNYTYLIKKGKISKKQYSFYSTIDLIRGIYIEKLKRYIYLQYAHELKKVYGMWTIYIELEENSKFFLMVDTSGKILIPTENIEIMKICNGKIPVEIDVKSINVISKPGVYTINENIFDICPVLDKSII
jgi:hypothetical protein